MHTYNTSQWVNTLHSDISNRHSSYTTLAGAHSGFLSPRRQWLPFIRYKPNAHQGLVEETHLAIYFDLPGSNRQGCPMIDLATGSLQRIHGGEDQVLAGCPNSVFRIISIGGVGVQHSRMLPTDVTRGELGVWIAKVYEDFMKVDEAAHMSSLNPIKFENLVLVSLRNTFENTWQAELAIDAP